MIERQGSLLVADEIFYNLNGKAHLQGIYHGDIFIWSDQIVAAQLVFFFMAETSIENYFRSLMVEVTLPGNEAVRAPVQIQPPTSIPAGRTRVFYRWPLLIPAPTLRPGRIEARLIYEDGEIIVAAPWIVPAQPQIPQVKPN